MLTFLCLALVAVASAQHWDTLLVSFPRYNGVPRSALEAVFQGWTELSSGCEGNLFHGRRFVMYEFELGDYDYSVIPIYDNGPNGLIAGLQIAVPSDIPNGRPNFPSPQMQEIVKFDPALDRWIQTVYFVDQAIICGAGRSLEDFDRQGSGDRLILHKRDSYETMPMTQSGADSSDWSKGKCFPGMGQHFWYDIRRDMSCDEARPIFLLYDAQGRLYAFGFAFFGTIPGLGYERATGAAMGGFFPDNAPECLLTYPHLSSLHVYLSTEIFYC